MRRSWGLGRREEKGGELRDARIVIALFWFEVAVDLGIVKKPGSRGP